VAAVDLDAIRFANSVGDIKVSIKVSPSNVDEGIANCNKDNFTNLDYIVDRVWWLRGNNNGGSNGWGFVGN
jgi:hypothetical protein